MPDRDADAVDGEQAVIRESLQKGERAWREIPAALVTPVGDGPTIMVAPDAGDPSLGKQRERLLGEQAVVEEIAGADDPVATATSLVSSKRGPILNQNFVPAAAASARRRFTPMSP
jgi:hypothetical protein